MAEVGEKRLTRREFIKLAGKTAAVATLAPMLAACDRITESLRLPGSHFGERVSDEIKRIRVVNLDSTLIRDWVEDEPSGPNRVNVREEPRFNSGKIGEAVANNPDLVFQAIAFYGGTTGARIRVHPETKEEYGLWHYSDQIPDPEGQKLAGFISSTYTEEVEPPPKAARTG